MHALDLSGAFYKVIETCWQIFRKHRLACIVWSSGPKYSAFIFYWKAARSSHARWCTILL